MFEVLEESLHHKEIYFCFIEQEVIALESPHDMMCEVSGDAVLLSEMNIFL